MSDYVIINDKTRVIMSEFSEKDLKTLFPFLTVGDSLEYSENLIKVSVGWAGNSLYKKL